MCILRPLSCVAIAALAVCCACEAWARQITTIALTGQPIPGSQTGERFGALYFPVINNRGDVLFRGSVLTSRAAHVSLLSGGALITIAKEGGSFTGVSEWDLGENGSAVGGIFLGGVPIPDNAGMFRSTAGVLTQLAQRGDPIPPPAANVEIETLTLGEAITPTGEVWMPAELRGDVTASNDSALLRSSGSGFEVVFRAGEPAPLAGGAVFGSFRLTVPLWDAAGHIAFSAFLSTSQNAIYSNRSGSLVPAYLEGQSVMVDGQPMILGDIRRPDMNRHGNLAFVHGDQLVVEDGGSLRLIAQKGQQAPGSDPVETIEQFDSFLRHSMNDAGDVTFGALISNRHSTSDDRAIFTYQNDVLRQVARDGGPVPGLGPGFEFVDLAAPHIDGAGNTIFWARYSGPGVSFRPALFEEVNGELQLLLEVGDTIEVAPGDVRTIASLGLENGNSLHHNNQVLATNEAGDLVFYAQFTDSSYGIFLATHTVPEPSAAMLLLVGAILLSCAKFFRTTAGRSLPDSPMPTSYSG
jgi:hypothetical protein